MTTEDRGLVLLQSRLSSSRLPGKSLLPICDYPMVVLAAKRAENTGLNVRVLTSTDGSDDAICEALENYEIGYFRGSLNNVLKRFNDALDDYSDSTKVFRLTADNVLPDGTMLDEMESVFNSLSSDILCCDSLKSYMPYGLAAELTTVGWIRRAYKNAQDAHDTEHVTPFIHRNGNRDYFQSKKIRGYQNLRVTIDTFDDYLSVRSLFEGVENPCEESINTLISNFQKMKYRPYYEPALKPMTLGSVQFGLGYGITNEKGVVSERDSISIIRKALTEGIQYIDTASAYGDSERVIGKSLAGGWSNRVKVVTKLPPFTKDALSANQQLALPLMVRNSFLQSCINLKVDHVDTFMLHRADHLKYAQILNELIKLRTEGVINNIGVSVQSPQELKVALKNKEVSVIQMPYNILDYRWASIIDLVRREREKRSLIIHARSALLQGLLCSEDTGKWLLAGIKNSTEIVNWLKSKFKQYEKMSVPDLCIGYVNSQDWIDSVVIGVVSEKNLFSSLQSISMPLMPRVALDELATSRPHVEAESLNPANWRTNV